MARSRFLILAISLGIEHRHLNKNRLFIKLAVGVWIIAVTCHV